ncbi:ephrin type-B receptor 5 isoform X7 [Phalacrocorax aristotelis]|uniref:ephrin type-B receptor 5 isoform X7 n=1 Tax=Phalacrocorax aristotelis TaxID=126867 RepID=UPI003F4C89FB
MEAREDGDHHGSDRSGCRRLRVWDLAAPPFPFAVAFRCARLSPLYRKSVSSAAGGATAFLTENAPWICCVRTKTEILLDTTGETSEIGWITHPSDGWDEVSVLDDKKRLIRTFEVCNVAEPGQNNWLRTHFIERRGAHRVHVRLRFSVRDCASMRTVASSCKETFTLYYHQSEADIASQELPEWREGPWTKVDTIAADESFSQVDSTGKVVKMNVKVRSFGPLTKTGFYLAFQDSGACMSLVAVQVFFYKCPAVVKGFASFPETFAGGERTSLVESPGICVPNAEEISMTGSSGVRLHCNGEGEWMVAIGRCTCKAGYQSVDGERACQEYEPPNPWKINYETSRAAVRE